MARPRLADDVRQAIIADLRATVGTPEGTYRRIAKRHEVSISTVAKVAKEAELDDANAVHERLRTATRAKIADGAARRAEICAKLLAVADEAVEDMSRPALVYSFGGKNNTYAERMISQPDFRGRRDLAQVVKVALDTHKMLDQYDSDSTQTSVVDAWLKTMIEGGHDGDA